MYRSIEFDYNMRYDLTLFKGTAKYYAKYRPGYSQGVFDLLKKKYNLNGKGRLLDLGTGTGQLTIPLARYFQEVIAMDPDKEMLAAGRKSATNAKIKNIKWVRGSSETLNKQSGKFRLVVMGRSFHWMKRREVLRKLYPIVVKGGGVVIVADQSTKGFRGKIAKKVIKKYIGPIRRAGNFFYRRPPGLHEKVAKNSPFQKVEIKYIPYRRSWTIDQIVGHQYSTSYASKFVLGKKWKKFDKELRSELKKVNRGSKYIDIGTTQTILLYKI